MGIADLATREEALQVIEYGNWFFGARFDELGMTIHPATSSGLRLPWSEVVFASLTPAMERTESGWSVKPNMFLEGRSLLDTHGILNIDFVIRDRAAVIARSLNLWNRAWVGTRLRRMYGAESNVLDDQACVNFKMRRHRLHAPLDDFLSLLASRCRFGLVVHDD